MSPPQAVPGNPWLPWSEGREDASHRVYCFAHAGASAAPYSSWRRRAEQRFSASSVDWVGVELPGRGARYGETPIDVPQSLLSHLHEALRDEFDKGPFSLLGHSLGGLLAFHLTAMLEQRNGPLPATVFISAASPSQEGLPRLRDLPAPQFLDAIGGLNGTPREVLAHSELVEVLLPALRADITVAELLRERTRSTVIQPPILTFSGDDDPSASIDAMQAWRGLTGGGFSQVALPGDHFFIREQDEAIRHAIVGKISSRKKHPST